MYSNVFATTLAIFLVALMGEVSSADGSFAFRDVAKEVGILPAASGIMGHGAGWGDGATRFGENDRRQFGDFQTAVGWTNFSEFSRVETEGGGGDLRSCATKLTTTRPSPPKPRRGCLFMHQGVSCVVKAEAVSST